METVSTTTTTAKQRNKKRIKIVNKFEMMCQKSSNSTTINKSPMDFESRCQKVIPTYLRIRMGRRSSFTTRTWPNSTTPDSTSPCSKISLENSWKSHCTIATRMNCDWQHRIEQSTMDHNRMETSTINHCHHSTDSKLEHKIQESTQNSHSIKTMMQMIGGQKSQSQSHIKHKLSDLHRTHKRTHSTSKSHSQHIHSTQQV